MRDLKIDVEAALDQLGGSKKLYATLLTGFLNAYKEVDKEIGLLASENNWEEATRLAHSIKGLCGNLGASELRSKAYELEKIYKEEKKDDDLLIDFSKELSEVIDEVKNLIASDIDYNKDMSNKDDKEICQELLDALQSYKVSEIIRIYKSFEKIKPKEEDEESIEYIRKNIDEFNYDVAAIELKRYISNCRY